MLASFIYPNRLPAGFAENEHGGSVIPNSFINKTGKIVERWDTGYDTDRPTGYEPVMYLVEFEEEREVYNISSEKKEFISKLWLPSGAILKLIASET